MAAIAINGDPYDNVTPIEALDPNGTVVAVAGVQDGNWVLQVPSNTSSVRFRIGVALSQSFPVEVGGLTVDVVLDFDVSLVRRIPLAAGTNAISYSGTPGASPAVVRDALDNPAALVVIFFFNAEIQDWQSWRPNVLAALNSLTLLAQHMPLFVIVSEATTYTETFQPSGPGGWNVAPGFTVLTFLGADGVAVEAALRLFGDESAVTAVFRFNNGTQQYDVHDLRLPATVRASFTLGRFDVLIVLASAPTTLPFGAIDAP